MLAVRWAKIVLVAAVALHATLVAFGNVTDYGTNFEFVRHVLSMDTIFKDSKIGYRAIGSPALHHVAYALIIAAEIATATLCWIGAWRLFARLRAEATSFGHAKAFAIYGLLLGLLVWQVGFITIGGEWFGMWMSPSWNGVPSAFRLVMILMGVLIFVALPDREVDRVAR